MDPFKGLIVIFIIFFLFLVVSIQTERATKRAKEDLINELCQSAEGKYDFCSPNISYSLKSPQQSNKK